MGGDFRAPHTSLSRTTAWARHGIRAQAKQDRPAGAAHLTELAPDHRPSHNQVQAGSLAEPPYNGVWLPGSMAGRVEQAVRVVSNVSLSGKVCRQRCERAVVTEIPSKAAGLGASR